MLGAVICSVTFFCCVIKLFERGLEGVQEMEAIDSVREERAGKNIMVVMDMGRYGRRQGLAVLGESCLGIRHQYHIPSSWCSS